MNCNKLIHTIIFNIIIVNFVWFYLCYRAKLKKEKLVFETCLRNLLNKFFNSILFYFIFIKKVLYFNKYNINILFNLFYKLINNYRYKILSMKFFSIKYETKIIVSFCLMQN